MEMFQNTGGSHLRLRWQSPSQEREIVPTDAFAYPEDFVVFPAAALMVLAAVSPAAAQPAATASVSLMDASGRPVGSATLRQMSGGVELQVQVNNLPPGQHGIHFHAVGLCEPPFTSAGGTGRRPRPTPETPWPYSRCTGRPDFTRPSVGTTGATRWARGKRLPSRSS